MVDEEERRKDPYLILGFGMIAYKDLLFTLIMLFSFLTIIISPAFFYFDKYNGINKNIRKPYVQYSLGNMVYTTTQCSLIPLGAGAESNNFYVPLSCPTNTSYDATY